MPRPVQGIPVLAYCESNAASPLSCSLLFKTKSSKQDKSRAQATLCLQSSLFIDGCDDKQVFILQYSATNIAPGKAQIGPATIPLPQARLDQVSRAGKPQIRTLSLLLKEECSVWCQCSDVPRKPRPGDEAPFYQLKELAKATKLYVLFDHNQLHSNYHSIFKRLVEHPELFEDFPVSQTYRERGLIRVDWSVFGAGPADADANADDDTEEEAWLPEYTQDCQPLRPELNCTARSSSPCKRVSLSPCPTACTSSTEQDSRAALDSPAPRHDGAVPSPRFPPLARLSPRRSQSPVPTSLSPAVQDAIKTTLKALLPDMIETRLPSMLKELIATRSLTPSSQASIASEMSLPPPPPMLSEFGVMLSECMTRRIGNDLDRTYAHTLSHANYLRNEADGAFFEERESERLEFDRIAEAKLEEFKQRCDAELERLEQDMDELDNDALKQHGEQKERLKEENLQLKREIRELKRDKADLRKDKEAARAELNWRKQRRKKRKLKWQTLLTRKVYR